MCKAGGLQTFKFREKTKKINQRLKGQTPPYLPNGEGLGKFYNIIGIKTLENGGVGLLQIPKKKPKLGQNVHVTQKP